MASRMHMVSYIERHEIRATNSLKAGSDEEEDQISKTSDIASHTGCVERDIDRTQQAYASLVETGLNAAAKVLSESLAQQSEAIACDGRLAILEFARSGPPDILQLKQAAELRAYFVSNSTEPSDQQRVTGGPTRRRLFILEDLPRDFVELLGSQLRIHPSFFARHCADLSFLDTYNKLPGQAKEIDQLFIPFMHFMHSPKVIHRPDCELAELYCANFIVRRILAWPKPFGGWDLRGSIAELECGISYWAIEYDDGGWDALLLVDPGMSDEVLFFNQTQFQQPQCRNSPIKIELEAEPGCIPYFSSVRSLPSDPTSWRSLEEASEPASTFDHLMDTYASMEDHAWTRPFECTEAIRRLALRKWVEFLNHAIHCLVITKGEPYLNNTHFSSPTSALWAPRTEEWLLGRLVKWSRRLHMEHTVISATMRDLGMDLNDQASFGMITATESKQWRYIRDKLLEYKSLYDDTAASYIQVMSLRESQTSNDQARSLGTITFIASLSVPISLIAGMFSMGDRFAPGGDQFWIFFVVVIPTVMVVWACLFTGFGSWAKSLGGLLSSREGKGTSVLPVFRVTDASRSSKVTNVS